MALVALAPLGAATYYVDFDGGNDDHEGTSPEAAFKHCPGDPGSAANGEVPGTATAPVGEPSSNPTAEPAPAPAANPGEGESAAEGKEGKTVEEKGPTAESSSVESSAQGKAKATRLQPGDVVLFKGGVSYRGVVRNSASGGEGSPIIFDGNTEGKFGSGRAIIQGGEAVGGWKKCANADEALGNPEWAHLWYTDEVPANADPYLINLSQGEKAMHIAVFPCSDALAVWNDAQLALKPAELPDTSNKEEHSFADPYFKQASADAWNGAYIGLRAGRNIFYLSPVTKFDPSAQRIYYKGITARYYPDLAMQRFTLLNAPEVLTRPGQYVLYSKSGAAGKRLYCWPWDEKSFPAHTRIATRAAGVVFKNCQHVVLRGFLIENQAGKLTESPAPGISCRQVDHLTIENNLLRHQRPRMNTRAAAIGIGGCKNVVVRKNEVRDTLTIGAMVSKCEGILFEDNLLDSVLDTSVDFYTNKDVRCLRNRVSGRSGLHANGLTFYIGNDNVLVEGNVVAHEIPFTMHTASNVRVVNNVFDGIGRNHGVALWAGGAIKDLVFEHNTIVNAAKNGTTSAGFYSGNGGTGWVIRNNIIDGAAGNIPAQTGILSHNLFLRTVRLKKEQLGKGGVLEEDWKKVFVDPENGNYQLASGSPAIGMGAPPSVETDIEGKGRKADRVDVGAYTGP